MAINKPDRRLVRPSWRILLRFGGRTMVGMGKKDGMANLRPLDAGTDRASEIASIGGKAAASARRRH